MVQRTSADETLTTEELAAYFEQLATEFGSSSDGIQIEVGNKKVDLSPPETVTASIDVVERSSMIRGDNETVKIELSWKP